MDTKEILNWFVLLLMAAFLVIQIRKLPKAIAVTLYIALGTLTTTIIVMGIYFPETLKSMTDWIPRKGSTVFTH